MASINSSKYVWLFFLLYLLFFSFSSFIVFIISTKFSKVVFLESSTIGIGNCSTNILLHWFVPCPVEEETLSKWFLPRENVNDAMFGSIYLSLDINPACPNTVIEALACGAPVVAFDTGSSYHY